jgi:Uma2 family endonuclease
MSSTAQTLITADELLHMPDNGKRRELVYGEVVETMPPGAIHGAIAIILGTLLRLWSKSGQGGYVGTESGFVLVHEPDLVRSPDVSYVSAARIPAAGIPTGYWHLAPDLAAEIVSPGDTAEEVREKVREYLAAGTQLVWFVYPTTREIVAHTPDGLARTFGTDATLEAPDVLPGFSCRVAEVFEP